MVAGGAIVCGLLAWCFKNTLVILSTACTGSYLVISGIAFFAGGFPSLTELYNLFKEDYLSVPYLVHQ